MSRLNLFSHLETRGVDMKSNALFLGNKKLHAATNFVNEEGVWKTRPGFRYYDLQVSGDFQGVCEFFPQRGLSFSPLSEAKSGLVTVVNGNLIFHPSDQLCEPQIIGEAIFCGKGDTHVYSAENYLIIQNPETATYWWDGTTLTKSPGLQSETWNDPDIPDMEIKPVAPVASITDCENFDYSDIILRFTIVNNDTEDTIEGAYFVLRKNANLYGSALSDSQGKLAFVAVTGEFNYNVSKEGFQSLYDVPLSVFASTDYVVRLKPDTCGFILSNPMLSVMNENLGFITVTNTGSITSNVTAIESSLPLVVTPSLPRALASGESVQFQCLADASLSLKIISVVTDCGNYAAQWPLFDDPGGGGEGGTCGYSISDFVAATSGSNLSITNTGSSVMTLVAGNIDGGLGDFPTQFFNSDGHERPLPLSFLSGTLIYVNSADRFESGATYHVQLSCNGTTFNATGSA